MSQQINLYNPAFRPQRNPLSAAGVLAVWGAMIALVAAVSGYGWWRSGALSAQEGQEATALSAARADVTRLAAQSAARQRDPALQTEILRLEAELNGRREVMQILQGGVLGNTEGFSEYLRAFARQSFEGLWLTGFTITGAGQDVIVEGRALRPEFVPDYLRRLNRERALQGHAFAELLMRTPERKGEDKEPNARAPFVEFRLATVPADNVRTGASAPREETR